LWLGTHQTFDPFTFAFEEDRARLVPRPRLPSSTTSTPPSSSRRREWRLGRPHVLRQYGSARGHRPSSEKLFASTWAATRGSSNATHLRGSANWIRFPRVSASLDSPRRGRRPTVPVVADGRLASHTRIFSIGSGTKLHSNTRSTWRNPSRASARIESRCSRAYEARRRVEVLKSQNAARNSTDWFRTCRATLHEISSFAYRCHALAAHQPRNLRLRDTQWLGPTNSGFGRQADRPMLMPAQGARPGAQEPHRRVFGPIPLHRGRRLASYFLAGGTWRPRCSAAQHGDGRDDQPDALRPHHGGLHTGCTTRQQAASRRIV